MADTPKSNPETPKELPKIEVVKAGDILPGEVIEDPKLREKIHVLMEKAGRPSGDIRMSWDRGVIYLTFPSMGDTILLRGTDSAMAYPDYTGKGDSLKFNNTAVERVRKYLEQKRSEIIEKTRTALSMLSSEFETTA